MWKVWKCQVGAELGVSTLSTLSTPRVLAAFGFGDVSALVETCEEGAGHLRVDVEVVCYVGGCGDRSRCDELHDVERPVPETVLLAFGSGGDGGGGVEDVHAVQ